MRKEKKQYMAPTLTIVNFHTEKGYALSGIGLAEDFVLAAGANSQEAWQADDSYSNKDWE